MLGGNPTLGHILSPSDKSKRENMKFFVYHAPRLKIWHFYCHYRDAWLFGVCPSTDYH